MAIDILTETLMPLADVPAWLEARGLVTPSRRRLTVRTVAQWVADGRLEATPKTVLNVQHTSEEALARMMARDGTKVRDRETPRQRRKQRNHRDRERGHAAAMEQLRKEGVA